MSNPLALYTITERFKALEALATTDDLPPDIVKDTLDGIEAEWQEKAVAVACFIKNLEVAAEAIDKAAAQQLARASAMKNRATSLKGYLTFQFQAMNVKKVEDPVLTIRLADNNPAVVVDDETAIPEQYWIQPETPPKRLDKTAVARAIKAGTEVPGAHTERGQSLRIEP